MQSISLDALYANILIPRRRCLPDSPSNRTETPTRDFFQHVFQDISEQEEKSVG